jgi:predicted DCC family thiol-disulfide oxidoreductase YuxK
MTSGDILTVLYDAECGFCARCAMVLRRLDRNRRLTFVALQAARASIPDAPSEEELATTLHVLDGAGHWERGGAACLRIATVLPALAPLSLVGRLPLVRGWIERLYELVARNRHRLSRSFGLDNCRLQATPADRA